MSRLFLPVILLQSGDRQRAHNNLRPAPSFFALWRIPRSPFFLSIHLSIPCQASVLCDPEFDWYRVFQQHHFKAGVTGLPPNPNQHRSTFRK
mmetsp:Transcript_10458/g.17948  ORF Transcript_10458/g.17948 Transcript_10458/m.17948 type:complete len:92 (+) Transcript_10458:292-567(+)